MSDEENVVDPAVEDGKRRRRVRTDGPSAEMRNRRAERLARGSVDHEFDKRLNTAGMKLDLRNYSYRWVNTEPGRIQRLEGAEWEVVQADELNGVEGSVHAGLTKTGVAMSAVLMKKWRPWFAEDQERKRAEHREMEGNLRRGKAAQQIEAQERAGGEKQFYVPAGNTVSVANPTVAVRPGDYNP